MLLTTLLSQHPSAIVDIVRDQRVEVLALQETTNDFVKKLDEAITLQTDYAKSSYEGFVAQATKMGEMYQAVAKEAFKPVEGAIAKMQAAAK